jgi:hypothetical protein
MIFSGLNITSNSTGRLKSGGGFEVFEILGKKKLVF